MHCPLVMAAGCSLSVSRHHRISHITLVSNGCYSHCYHHLHCNMCNSTADTNVMAVSVVVVAAAAVVMVVLVVVALVVMVVIVLVVVIVAVIVLF